jgi:hypothetical protein
LSDLHVESRVNVFALIRKNASSSFTKISLDPAGKTLGLSRADRLLRLLISSLQSVWCSPIDRLSDDICCPGVSA